MKYLEKVILPSQIYRTADAIDDIAGLLEKGYRILDFRPTRLGDYWINAIDPKEVLEHNGIKRDDGMPRFIVQPPAPTQTISQIWE